MFDTSASVQAAKTARAQTASPVAVVADPNPAGSYGTIPGFTGLHATASIYCLMQLSGEAVFVLEDADPHVVGQAFAAHRRGGYRLSTMDGPPIPYSGLATSVRRAGLRAMRESMAASSIAHEAPCLDPRSLG